MQSGNKLFYRLVLHDRGGKKHTFASQIRDQRLARRIVRDLEEALAKWGSLPVAPATSESCRGPE